MPDQKRQLAAIMFTDIVGYTALMGKDSAKALELVRVSKEIQKPLIERHHGKWLKEIGDGALAQFNSAMDAVECSIEIQKSARAELDAKLRIGIHLGDVTIQEDDVYGDGVNVASRLESIADPGGIYVSDAIEKAIRGQSDIQARYLGEVKLKNVDYDVRAYALQGVGLPVPDLKEDKNLSGRFIAEIQRRGVLRAGATYIVLSLLLILLLPYSKSMIYLPSWSSYVLYAFLIAGFPIAMYFAWNYERSPEGFVRTTSKESWQNPYKGSRRKPLTSTFIIAILGMITVFMYIQSRYHDKTSDKIGVRLDSEILEKSVAVIPFIDDSPNKDNEHIINGIMEELIINLQSIKDLQVPGRTSVEQYRYNPKPVPEIAKDLRVNYVIEGSGQMYGNLFTLRIQLLEGATGMHLWGESIKKEILNIEDISNIQSTLALSIAGKLEVLITPEQKQRIEKIPTTSLTAYELYLKGQAEFIKYYSNRSNRAALERAEDLYRYALEYDSTFAKAYAGLTWVYWMKGFAASRYVDVDIDSILILADIVLNYDDQLEDGYILRGNYFKTTGKRDQAIEEYNKALKFNPNNWWTYNDLGYYYLWSNDNIKALDNFHKAAALIRGPERPAFYKRSLWRAYDNAGFSEKAAYYIQEALKLDGDSVSYYLNSGMIEYHSGNYEKAIKALEKVFLVDKNNAIVLSSLGDCYMYLNQYEKSLDFFKKWFKEISLGLDSLPGSLSLGYAYLKNGFKEEAEYQFSEIFKHLNKVKEREGTATSNIVYYNLAALYLYMGKKDKVYEILRMINNKLITPTKHQVTLINNDYKFDSIRNEPEYQEIVRDIEDRYQAEHEKIRKWLEQEGLL